MSSRGSDDDYRIVARYTLNDGRSIALRKKGPPAIENGMNGNDGGNGGDIANLGQRRGSEAPLSDATGKKRPSIAPRQSSASMTKARGVASENGSNGVGEKAVKDRDRKGSAAPDPTPAGPRRPSLAPRKSSALTYKSRETTMETPAEGERKKAPKLPERKDSAAPQKPPSLVSRQSSTSMSSPQRALSETSSNGPRERPPKLPPRPPQDESKERRPSAIGRASSGVQSPAQRKPSVDSQACSGAQSPTTKRPSISGRTGSNVNNLGSRRPSGLSRGDSDVKNPVWRRPSANTRTPSNVQDSTAKRPSVPGRTKSNALDSTARRPSGLSRTHSQAQGDDQGFSRPSVATRATSDVQNAILRRPSRLSRSTSQAQESVSNGPSLSNQPASDPQNTASERPAEPHRSLSKAEKVAFKENSPSTPDSAPKRPSTPSGPTSQIEKAAPERQSQSIGANSDAQGLASRRPSSLSRSTSQAEKPVPRRPSLVTGKGSQSANPRPPLSSTPSGKRVSFHDDAKKSSATPDAMSKLPNLSEEYIERPEVPSYTPQKESKMSEEEMPSDRKNSSGDRTPEAASEMQETPKDPVSDKPKQPPKLAKKQEARKTKPSGKSKLPPKSSKQKPVSHEPEMPKESAEDGQKNQNGTPKTDFADSDRDLKSILTEDQCADLTLLVADITKRMREDIESHFDALKGLKLFKDDNGGDAFENLDYDPGTVDVSAYDKERKIRDEQTKELAKPETKKLMEANLKWFDEWREVVILRVGEAVNSKEKASGQRKDATPQITSKAKQQQVQKINAGAATNGTSGPKLEDLFPRVKTPLTKLPMGKRVLVLHSVMLLLLSLEHYNAASRVLLLYMTTSLKIGLSSLRGDEEKTAQGLLTAAKQMSADEEASKRLEESNNTSRKWKIRLASAAGAAVIGYTGGLAAPMIAAGVGSVMGELGLGATAAAGYLGTVAGSTAVVGSLFGAYGGRMTGQVMSNISAGVQDFAFLPIHGERKEHDDSVEAATNTRRLRVVVAISGWLLEKEEVVTPWRILKPSAEVFALRFELETLLNLGQSFDTMLQSAVYGYAQSAMVKRTIFSELMGGMVWPMALTKVARVVDNPFSLAQTRADKAGQVLADGLINHVQGERPVTLIGYSLGARVIWSCLTSLAKQKAFGLVESAVLMGAPIPSDTNSWRSMRAAVSGRLVNVYSENDYLLAFLYRTSSLQYGVAGLVPITGLAGIENVDVTETVSGHLRYRYLVGSILQKIRFEDVDKDEVAKESKAFEAIVEEEKKRTYIKQAGDLYQTYKGKKPQPKKKGRTQMEISDADAEKQASAMEKMVDQKTKTGLMQWAVEQLYLSSPSADEAKAKAAEVKDHAGTGGKSYYQWVKEATYLSRSGGTEAKKALEDKKDHAQASAQEKTSQSKSGYLSSAAGYIPTGYVPSIRSSSKEKDVEKPETKKSDDHPDEPSAEEKSGYLSSAAGYIPTSYVPSVRGSSKEKKDEKPNTAAPKDHSEKPAAEAKSGYSSYIPSFGLGGSAKKGKQKKSDDKPDQSSEAAQDKSDGSSGKAEGTSGNAAEGKESREKKSTDSDHTAEPKQDAEETQDNCNDTTEKTHEAGTILGEADDTADQRQEPSETSGESKDTAEEELDTERPEEEADDTAEERQEAEETYEDSSVHDHWEDTAQSMTSDTEGGGGTDEDPFMTPPSKGSTAFTDAAKAAEKSR